MRHLRLANGGASGVGLSKSGGTSQVCYIFIDWGTCSTIDQCGFDFGNCPTQKDVCLVDY